MTKSQSIIHKPGFTLGGLAGVFVVCLPFFGEPFYIHIFILVFLYATLAISYRLLYITGLGSFCHVTFFGIGAYTSSLLAVRLGVPYPVCFLAAGLAPAAVAIALGLPAVRVRGPYFFLVTFALWAVVDRIFRHWDSLTGGPGGVTGIPPIMGVADPKFYYYMSLIFAVLVTLVMFRLDKSRFGAELLAIGDADNLAESIGINVVRHRILAFAIGAAVAGFAGSIFAHYTGFISPGSFPMMLTCFILIWCVIGGARKVYGPVAGTILLTLIAEGLRMSGPMQAILYGIALVVVITVMPQGIVGLVDRLQAGFRKRKHPNKGTKLTSEVR